MVGKKNESRQGQESLRKGQISDESGKKDTEDINYNFCEKLQNSPELSLDLDIIKEEDAKKNGIHFYTLSIMNETNKVHFIKNNP